MGARPMDTRFSGSGSITVSAALVGAELASEGPVTITWQDGQISGIAPAAEAPSGRRVLAMPAPVNAHDHARPISPTSFGIVDRPLELALPALSTFPSVDAELATAVSLGRSAMGGACGAMIHLTRPMGLVPLPEEGLQIARAAARVGIRAALAIAMKDRNPLIYGDHNHMLQEGVAPGHPEAARHFSEVLNRPSLTPAEQIARAEEVAEALADTEVDVQFGPAGPQWCSDALLQTVAARSAETGRRVHMHLLETRYQRAWADSTYPDGLVRHLRDIGLLSPRLTVAHGIYARPDELEMIAEAGATIAINASGNMVGRNGIAPGAAMLASGCRLAMGIDGGAFDDDDDALRELRMMKALNRGWGLDEGLDPTRALQAACMHGRRSIGAPDGGLLAPGAPADILLVDLDALDRDRLLPVDPVKLVLRRARKEQIVQLLVAGRTVVADGGLTGFDLAAAEEELRAAYRAGMAENPPSARLWPALEPATARFYHERFGCC